MNSSLLILAVCWTRVTYQPSKWPHESLVAQLIRAPNRYLGGHGFDSRRELSIFCLLHARVIVEKYIFTIYYQAQNLPSDPSSMQDVCYIST